MFFDRIEDKGLAQYSYVIACERAGTAAVVDPRRDVDVYLDIARAKNVRITHVLETHIHADFASGARELAQATGAEIVTSAYDRGETFETQFPHCAVADGEAIELGRVRLQAVHTPGHTPEHVSYLVFDGARSTATPMIMLSGDFLFVGSLGRPDLLGEAETRQLAGRLYASVRRVLSSLPDGLEIAPGHGAGSMCGAGMSSRASTTLGFERIANPYLRPELNEAQFVDAILSRVPPFPAYYRRMKALNARGPRVLGTLPGVTCIARRVRLAEAAQAEEEVTGAASASGATLECIAVARVRDLLDTHVIVDVRDQLSFGKGHIPGSFGIGAGTNVSTWASWVVPYDTPMLLVAARDEDAEAAIRSLVRVGLDDVRGIVAGGVEAWRAAGYDVATTTQIAPAALASRLGESGLHVIDVRSRDEWQGGHVPGAQHIMAGELASRLGELPSSGTLALICGTGYRSTVAASVLERAGRGDLVNVTGGMAAWRAANLPIQDVPPND